MGIDAFYAIDEDYKLDIRGMRHLLRLLREHQIDILHCHCYKSDLYGLILSRFHKMQLVTTVHGPLASWKYFWASQNWRVRYLYDQLDLKILRFYKQVIVVSESMRGTVLRHGAKNERVITIHNAIDSKHFTKNEERGAAFRRARGIPADAVVVGAVGRLNGEKDYPTLFKAAQLLVQDGVKVLFTIAGGGPLEQDLKQQVAAMGLQDHVIFLGHNQDVREIYDAMDIYALSSTREGLPNTVLEALAMEVPVVATDVDGVGEVITDGVDGILLPAQDPGRLAAGIRRLLEDAALRARFVSAGRTRVEEHFSFSRRMRKIERIYRFVMGRESSPA
jgi:glycosyltransferase involved in cell wall biosynthesis